MTSSVDSRLFDDLYERHHGVVFALAFGQTGERETATDLVQETFVRTWLKLADIARIPDERRVFWIIAVARNVVIDHRRRRAVRPEAVRGLEERDRSAMPSPEQIALDRVILGELDCAIRELPEDLRTVLSLSVLGGLASDEIGGLLGRPSGTVRYQLSEARKRLARRMGTEI